MHGPSRSRARSTIAGIVLVLTALIAPSVLAPAFAPAFAQADEFPFGRELLLDARPMRGSKRVPIIEIAADGRGTVDFWCNSAEVTAVIVADTITFLLGRVREQPCPPERARADEAMVQALTQVTHWRREGPLVVFTGGTTLRFRPATN